MVDGQVESLFRMSCDCDCLVIDSLSSHSTQSANDDHVASCLLLWFFSSRQFDTSFCKKKKKSKQWQKNTTPQVDRLNCGVFHSSVTCKALRVSLFFLSFLLHSRAPLYPVLLAINDSWGVNIVVFTWWMSHIKWSESNALTSTQGKEEAHKHAES